MFLILGFTLLKIRESEFFCNFKMINPFSVSLIVYAFNNCCFLTDSYCCTWSIYLYGVEAWTRRKVD